ncbi:uncharacterized protein LOC129821080 [Salvelinus fontinalis]|uniref:uncharacterized protein LOC129821080 n=1 Tax=Salvelinus fontinalis TaxID=8038 RepID=UPI002485B7A7|nr:uncharacterized protein LOC129821080 [Salvelinus fontinalis]
MIIRRQCINYIVALSKELQARLPDNLEALRHLALFSVKETLKHNKGTTEIIKVAELLGYQLQTIDKIVSQWRNIHLFRWDSTENTVEFWSEVNNYTDSSGSNPFEELFKAALAALSLPHSNAEVQWLFSQMIVVKSKLRNRMSLYNLNSILLVRYGLKLAGDTCYQHKLRSEVLQQFGTTAAYSFKATPSSTAGSSSVTMQLDSEDEEDFLANL